MNTTPILQDPVEALLMEQALAFIRELRATADAAPDGQVLAQAERVAVDQGRELIRQTLQTVLQAQAEAVEKKGFRRGAVTAGRDATTKASRPQKS
jgi:hypothetical protein